MTQTLSLTENIPLKLQMSPAIDKTDEHFFLSVSKIKPIELNVPPPERLPLCRPRVQKPETVTLI